MNDDQLRALEELLWHDVHGPGDWMHAADAVAQALGARGSLLLPVHNRRPGVPRSQSLEAFEDAYFRERWYERDFRFGGVGIMHARGVVVDQDLGSQETLDRQPSYQFLYRHGLKYFAAIPFEVAGDPWVFSVHRTAEQGVFTARDEQRLRRARTVIQNGATLSGRLAQARTEGVMDTFEALQGACALLDRTGRVLVANAAALALLGDGLSILGNKMKAAGARSDAALQAHLAAALWDQTAGDDPSLLPVMVDRQDGLPLAVRAVPFRGSSFGYFARSRVLLLISEIGARSTLSTRLLQQLFDLAPAEAGLAEALSRHLNLFDAARDQRITYEHARTKLKTVFRKMHVTSQLEFAAMLAQLRVGLFGAKS